MLVFLSFILFCTSIYMQHNIVGQSIATPVSDYPAGKLAALSQIRTQSSDKRTVQLRNILLKPALGNTLLPECFGRADVQIEPVALSHMQQLARRAILTIHN